MAIKNKEVIIQFQKDNPQASRADIAKRFKIGSATVSRLRQNLIKPERNEFVLRMKPYLIENGGDRRSENFKSPNEPLITSAHSPDEEPAETWAERYAKSKHERLTGTGGYAPRQYN